MSDLKRIAAEEGNRSYNYSAFDTPGNPEIELGISGATVAGILESAGIAKTDIEDTDVIHFMAIDGHSKELIGKQLFKEERYYYPNISGNINWARGTMNPKAEEDKIKVPTIIRLDGLTYADNKMYIGQVRANEQNRSLYVNKMSNGGIINVEDTDAAKCKAVNGVSPQNSIPVPLGAEVTIERTLGYLEKNLNQYEKIYYTLDGTGNYALAPSLFHNWLDFSLFVQIIGMLWIGNILWPELYSKDLAKNGENQTLKIWYTVNTSILASQNIRIGYEYAGSFNMLHNIDLSNSKR